MSSRAALLRRGLAVEDVEGWTLPYDEEGFPDFFGLRFRGRLIVYGRETGAERDVTVVLDAEMTAILVQTFLAMLGRRAPEILAGLDPQ